MTMETRELLERVERGEEAAQEGEAFGRRAAVLVSILAAFLAISSLAGNRAATEAILSQEKASDTYNEYQANSLKRHVNLDDSALLRIIAAGSPNEAAALKQAASLDQAVAEKYQPNQDALLPHAQELEHERDIAESRHRVFEMAEAGFQIAIVLSSISIVARASALLMAGGALGIIGLLLALDGFTLAVPLPF